MLVEVGTELVFLIGQATFCLCVIWWGPWEHPSTWGRPAQEPQSHALSTNNFLSSLQYLLSPSQTLATTIPLWVASLLQIYIRRKQKSQNTIVVRGTTQSAYWCALCSRSHADSCRGTLPWVLGQGDSRRAQNELSRVACSHVTHGPSRMFWPLPCSTLRSFIFSSPCHPRLSSVPKISSWA